jgi:6-phosphogluconolactonase
VSTIISMRRFSSNAEFDAALVERVERAITNRTGSGSAIMLSGGRTPLPTYREVAARKPTAAQGLHILFSDDRYVPITSESSNFFQTRQLVNALDLPDSQVLRVKTELPLEQAAADYDRQLAALLQSGARVTLGLLGLGADGHTASLFNATNLEQARGKLAVAVQRPDGLQGVSVTPDFLAKVTEPLFLVTGADKHAIVQEFLKPNSKLISRRALANNPKAEIWIAE